MVKSLLMLPSWFLLLCLPLTAMATTDLCEKIDGDCPDDCAAAGFNGDINFTALILISPTHFDVEWKAYLAEKYIQNAGKVHSVDNPIFGLHTSLFYFCCHTTEEKSGIKNALHNMEWDSFQVSYDSFACNLDHNNSTVYLHALPSQQ